MIAEETKKQTWEEMGKREEAVEYAGRVGGRTEQVAKLGKRHHFSDASLRHVVLLTRPRGDFGWGGGGYHLIWEFPSYFCRVDQHRVMF